MKEQLITFETAKLAKEKGVIIKSDIAYNSIGTLEIPRGINYYAPTQSLLQKWLREVHNIHTNVHYGLTFTFKINGDLKGNDYVDYSEMDKFWGRTYEEALEKGLQEALKLI